MLQACAPPTRPSVQALLAEHALLAHFQPLVQLANAQILGHEALVRTPVECPWQGPDALFAAAREEGLAIELEIECLRAALLCWGRQRVPGKLFINLSAQGLVAALAQRGMQAALERLKAQGLSPGDVVIELTEHERVHDFEALRVAVRRLRQRGIALALDDFGDGRSSLRLWSELKPEIVKIDKYFVHDLPHSADKVQTLRALMQISDTLGADLVAEGIETLEELRVLRDLGLRLGQGWLLGRPAAVPTTILPAEVHQVLQGSEVAVLPQRARVGNHGATAAHLLREAEALPPCTPMAEVYAFWQRHPQQPLVALVQDQRPVGLIHRGKFIADYARPYFRELHGRKPCIEHANRAPLLLELSTGIDQLTAVLTSDDQHYLTEGFLLTERGQYRGIGTGEQLVRLVTEARIEAARHANPLTFLPGNIPISDHIRRLLERRISFVACYADLNHFKPFNDHYGYWRGDEMIRLVARTALACANPYLDFVGHVGGDDFVLLFQSPDWIERCHRITETFNQQALGLFDAAALAAGHIEAEDRHGQMCQHPLTTLSIGALQVIPGRYRDADEVANAAATAKWQAKRGGVSVMLLTEHTGRVAAPLPPR